MHASILRYFAEVARSGSIRKASEELNVATSALSRQIKKLEDELGTPLFERFSDGLRLTHAGEIVLRHATDTLRHFDLMRSEIGEMRGKRTGRVHIACLDSLAIQFLPEFVRRFHHQHPAIDFRIRTESYNTIFKLLAEGDCDIGITFDLARPPDIDVVTGVSMPLRAIVASSHPLARQASVTLQECAQFRLLLQLDHEVMSSIIAWELGSLDRVSRTFVATNSQMMLKPLILSGDGIAFFTCIGLLKELEEGLVKAVPIAGLRLSPLEMAVVTPSRRQLTGATMLVAEQLALDLQRFAERIYAATPVPTL